FVIKCIENKLKINKINIFLQTGFAVACLYCYRLFFQQILKGLNKRHFYWISGNMPIGCHWAEFA
ncbi:hypothetical protein, partial [Neisseria canis]|uniref:hypothetical protein n=1 Tax=Neisseria canis TaxID=493 RepID=UPI001B8050DE